MAEGSDNYTYHYNQFNQLTSVDKNSVVGNSTYQYDSRGNQTKEISKETISGQTVNITKTHTYNKADGLVRTNVAQEGVVESLNVYNTYNGDGQRVKKITGLNDTTEGVATKYYYVGLNLLFTTDKNGNKATENILDPGGNIIASKRFDGNYDNMYFFYQYDVRGSVNNIIKPDGTLVKGYNYDEFGNQKETGDQNFKNEVTFTGAVSDSGSGLYYMNARHYDPGTGRFLSQDTYSGNAYDPMTQHLYTYTGNNPVNYVDPTGHAYIVGETRNGQVGTIAHPSNPKRIINYRKEFKTPYKSSGSSTSLDKQRVTSTVLSPGNLVDTNASVFEVLGAAGQDFGTDAIKNTVRPNNIGLGTWNKYIENESTIAAAKFGRIARYSKYVGRFAVGVDVGSGIYENVKVGSPNKKIASDAAVDTMYGAGGLLASTYTGAAAGSVVPGAGNVVGAVVGFGVGVFIIGVTEIWQPGGLSIKDRTKESIYNLIDR